MDRSPEVEIVTGDVGDPQGLAEAMRGCGAAYYLVHSMVAAGSDYAERDRELARNFAAAAEAAGCSRIVYLGGLGETGAGLSEHLSSRREVEETLAEGAVPVTVLRAAMIIGSGSASFEILRYLVERLPVMITPRWVSTECQPIAVRDVLHYLVESLANPETLGRTLDIGGPEILTYLELMKTYAEAAGLRKRIILPVPVLTPRLCSLWIHLVTPLDAHIARPLAEGLKNRVVCRNDEAARLMPRQLLTVRQAIDAALGHGPSARPRGATPARSPATPTGPAARAMSTASRPWSRRRPAKRFAPSSASAARTAGTASTRCGGSAAGSISWSAARDCAAAAATPTRCATATRSISGASPESRSRATCGCGPR